MRARPDYDRVARWFRPLERGLFGRSLERTRGAFLDQIEAPRRVLLLGEGDGRFLAAFLDRHDVKRIDVVEGSARMIELARERVTRACGASRAGVVRWQHDDVRSAPIADGYDLVVSNFLLDCLDEAEIDALVGRVTRSVTSPATWLVADFRVPRSGGVATLRARAWITFLYAFFGVAARQSVRRLVDPAPSLRAHGWSLADTKRYRAGLLEATCWRLRPSE